MNVPMTENIVEALLLENPDLKFSINVEIDHYTITVHGQTRTGILYTHRNALRTFAKADSAIKCLAGIGAKNVVVNMPEAKA